jgi:hypothetical protein
MPFTYDNQGNVTGWEDTPEQAAARQANAQNQANAVDDALSQGQYSQSAAQTAIQNLVNGGFTPPSNSQYSTPNGNGLTDSSAGLNLSPAPAGSTLKSTLATPPPATPAPATPAPAPGATPTSRAVVANNPVANNPISAVQDLTTQGSNTPGYGTAVSTMMGGGTQNAYQSPATPTNNPITAVQQPTASNPNISPAASKATNGGTSLVPTPGTNTSPTSTPVQGPNGNINPTGADSNGAGAAPTPAPATPAPGSILKQGTDAMMTGTQNNYSAVAPAPKQSGPALDFHGNGDPVYQTNVLTHWLKGLGLTVPQFSVGGTSSYDTQINGLINQINSTNDPTLQKSYAEQLIQYLGLRTSTVTGAQFQYDPATGNIIPKQGAPGGSTSNEMIANLPTVANPNGVSFTNPTTEADRSQFQSMLKQLTDPSILQQEGNVQRGQLQSDLANRLNTQKTQMAEQMGGQGVQGGVLQSNLLGLQNASNADFASGDSAIQSQIFQQEQASKQAGLSAILQQSGLDQQAAEQLATLLVSGSNQQASLAQQATNNQTQLEQSGAYNTASLGLQGRQQQVSMIIALLNLAAQGDAAAEAQAMQLITGLGTQ